MVSKIRTLSISDSVMWANVPWKNSTSRGVRLSLRVVRHCTLVESRNYIKAFRVAVDTPYETGCGVRADRTECCVGGRRRRNRLSRLDGPAARVETLPGQLDVQLAAGKGGWLTELVGRTHETRVEGDSSGGRSGWWLRPRTRKSVVERQPQPITVPPNHHRRSRIRRQC